MTKSAQTTLKQTLPFILLIGGVIGVLCAGILTVEKIKLLTHPNAHLLCDINPIVACGSVINTPQATAFGFPNPIIGLVGFGGVAVIGAGLLAGATFKRWFWRGLQIGVTFGVGFVTWLQFQSMFRIHALCPFCMVVWAVMIPLFWYTTLYNAREGHLGSASVKVKPFVAFIQKHHGDILMAWFLLIFGIILHQFWYYWKTVL